MGVHGLWELLAPVGRRVSVETLAGKKLAIDASIWMIQFMKAMRDEKGEMVKNAHILGFFRRICKLLFLRTKPVFVFDGGTPALKRRTVIARRRQRENAQAKIRKTAEKLLLNHLKAMKLKELADNLESQRQNKDAKGKKILVEEAATAEDKPESDDPGLKSYNQEKLDEMLAASLAAESDGVFGTASTSGGGRPYSEEDDSDEDEEMILPAMHGKIDPAALASLPPSMQLDLLGQMRERLMADNRQRYQKVKKVPAKFSELQIQAYLKTVAFRREINEVQKSAAGRGVGGAQVSRIASEANREFIFSSSFTGDKQALTSAGVEENGDKHQTATEHPSSNSLGSIACTAKANTAAGSGMVDEPGSSSVDGVETYLDERGHVRVSRVRAMGIRMTRDLQRNLELMKEIEKERMNANDNVHAEPSFDEENYGLMRNGNQCVDDIVEGDEETVNMNSGVNTLIQDDNDSEQSMSKNGISIEISFEQDTEHKCVDGDDGDIFARLVAEAPVGIPSVDCNPSEKLSSGSASDCDWEEGTVAENRSNFKAEDLVSNFNADTKSPLAEINSDESDVEWEEGGCGAQDNASPCQDDCGVAISKGNLEEESNIQEAIKRSLEDLNNQRSFHQLSENHKLNFPLLNVQHQNGFEVADVEKPMPEEGLKTVRDTGNSEGRLTSPVAVDHDKQMDGLADKPYGRCNLSDSKHTRQDAIVNDNLTGEVQCRESVLSVKPMELPLTDQLADTSRMGDQVSSFSENCFGASSSISNPSLGDSADVFLVDAAPSCHPDEMVSVSVAQGMSSVKKAKTDINTEIKMVEEINDDSSTKERENDLVERANWENRNIQVDISAATLEEEMLILDQERTDLGDEQRKLERNAESVSSEMFAECQELLQMFGLPYIIAPMEAEAQCAYMELTNLVDGVVTDDSDVFLFGAQSVYKNIFDDRKYVETYFMKDIESELGLTREKIIRMALLLGSDYTEGVSGIGIVNAMEVVNAFPEEHGLHKFREWIESPDPTILGKVNGQTSSRKRESKVSDSSGRASNSKTGASSIEESVSEVQHSQSDDDMQNMKQTFMDQHRNISKNWHIPSSFPSEAVISAYVSPKVDKSTDPFSWGKPDLLILHKMCWEKFGWGSQKADELLLPVLKEYNKHETQLRLEAFYTFNERFAKIRSRRINKAVKGITAKQSLELVDDDASQDCRSRKKKRGGATKSGNLSENFLDGIGDNVAQGNGKSSGKKITKPPRKRSTQRDPLTSKLRNPESSIQAEGSRGSSGSGRGRGRGRRQGTGRGKRQKMSPSSDVTENGSDDGSDCSVDQRQQVQDSVESSEVQRSKRPRKPVKYTLNDLNVDDVDKSFDHEGHSQSIGESNNEKATEQEPSGSQSISEDAAAPASVQSERNQHGVGHPPLEMGLHHNYFKAGGGIKVSEGEAEKETVLAALSENVDPSFNTDISKDYLEIGGGFCVEEDENEDEPVECASNPPGDTTRQNGVRIGMHGIKHDTYPHELGSTLTMAADVVQGREETDSSFHDGVRSLDGISSSDCSIAAKPLQENVEKDANAGAGKPFSAMPLLRRKRRKS